MRYEMKGPDFEGLAGRFRSPGIKAIALMGSFARGDAGEFSDVDLVRFLEDEPKAPPEASTHVVEGRLIVVSNVPPSAVEKTFTEPEAVTLFMSGLRTGRPLWDPDGYFAELQRRAREFVWDDAMQRKADAYASREMVGWAEEVHKGLEGLRIGDVGRLLNARFGLCWGLPTVMRVQRGIMISGDNGSYTEVMSAMGEGSEWSRLCRMTFGLETEAGYAEEVKACLSLYVFTARLLEKVIGPKDRDVIDHAVSRILAELGGR